MRLRLTPQAEADLAAIAEYLEPRSPQGALRVEAAIQDALVLLARYPEAGHQRGQRVRGFALPRFPYVIFYRLDEESDTVEVFAIRHGARKPQN